MKAMTNNYQLNTEQLEAVNHIDGPLVCLAGPGTGKTQIIAMRIANLFEGNSDESSKYSLFNFHGKRNSSNA